MDIRVLYSREENKPNDVHFLDLEEYLRCVIPVEMLQNWHIEAYKAQTVAARTFALCKIVSGTNKSYDVDDTTRYQAYKKNRQTSITDKAVVETYGEVLYYDDMLLDTCVYTSSNGGEIVSSEHRWGSKREYLISKMDPYDKLSGRKLSGHGVGMSQYGAQEMAKQGKSYKEILSFYYPKTKIMMLEDLKQINEFKQELGTIGVRGGHGVGDNVILSDYGYPAYSEGTFNHELSKILSEKLTFINLKPETQKVDFDVIAKRAKENKCKSVFYNHTNWSLDIKGNPNSSKLLIIYSIHRQEYRQLYESMAKILARYMNYNDWEVRTRRSAITYKKDYYGAIRNSIDEGILHPLIIEYGYHVDIAGKEEERMEQITGAYQEILGKDYKQNITQNNRSIISYKVATPYEKGYIYSRRAPDGDLIKKLYNDSVIYPNGQVVEGFLPFCMDGFYAWIDIRYILPNEYGEEESKENVTTILNSEESLLEEYANDDIILEELSFVDFQLEISSIRHNIDALTTHINRLEDGIFRS